MLFSGVNWTQLACSILCSCVVALYSTSLLFMGFNVVISFPVCVICHSVHEDRVKVRFRQRCFDRCTQYHGVGAKIISHAQEWQGTVHVNARWNADGHWS